MYHVLELVRMFPSRLLAGGQSSAHFGQPEVVHQRLLAALI